MSNWNVIATPSHPSTSLRIEAKAEAGRTGRYNLTAYDGEALVLASFYDWNVWLGHGYGALLMPAFVEAAEKERLAAKSTEQGQQGKGGGNAPRS